MAALVIPSRSVGMLIILILGILVNETIQLWLIMFGPSKKIILIIRKLGRLKCYPNLIVLKLVTAAHVPMKSY